MSKILYIAPVRDFSGYATASRGYITALHQAGADLVVRPVRYDQADPGTKYKPNAIECELLRRDLKDIDIVIQHVTPNEMRPVDGKINIAVVAWETTRIPQYWVDKLNQFNAVITFCEASVTAFKDSGVTVPIHKVPHTFHMASYDLTDVEPIQTPSNPTFLEDRYVFYNISQLSTKKGLDLLIRAYFTEFHGEQDKVVLMLKTYVNMTNREAEYKKIGGYVDAIKKGLRLPMDGYPPVMIMNKTMQDDDIRRLHASGDCYVCPSRGEGWCIPAFDALAYGKPLVTTLWGGMQEFGANKKVTGFGLMGPDGTPTKDGKHYAFIPKDNVYPIDYFLEPLIGQTHNDPELYTGFDKVAEPSVSSMMSQMRAAMDSDVKPAPDLNEFDYSVVGPQMLKVIIEISKSVRSKEAAVL